MSLKKRKIILIVFLTLFALLLILFFNSSYSTAIFKSKSHFIKSSKSDLVYYEPGAKNYADQIADFLPDAINHVEKVHGLPFNDSFKIYVCDTQKSLNAFIAQPGDWPVRGTVLYGKIFIAPSAFDWHGEDTHRGTLMHELSHLHLKQQLGFWDERVNTPVWFKEGLADYVCNCAGEGISDEEAITAFKNSNHFIPDESGGFFSIKRAPDYGVDYPMLHKQSSMFMNYLFENNSQGAKDFLQDFQSGTSFPEAFRKNFGKDLFAMWDDFVKDITSS